MPEATAFKLLWSEYHRVVTEFAVDVLGLDALVPEGRPSPNWFHTDDPGAPNWSSSWTSVFVYSYGELRPRLAGWRLTAQLGRGAGLGLSPVSPAGRLPGPGGGLDPMSSRRERPARHGSPCPSVVLGRRV
ncbi:hypothetical protein GCM10009610_06960 [Pseudonocardia xinjiangensis]